MKKVDFIIVGQGLAGTNLAFKLLEVGKSIIIVDRFREITSSKVAAGLVNPITGRRFAKTWLAEKIFPYAESYYQNLEINFNQKFYHQVPVYRYFGTIEDQNTWMGRSTDEEIKHFIGNFDNNKTEGILNQFGGVNIIKGGWLDTNLFLKLSRDNFESLGIIVDESLVYDDISFSESGVQWKGFTCEKVIFSEGFRAKDNPFFDFLPFTFAKGEILEIESDKICNDVIHNKNGFVLPTKANRFKVGATFRWNEMNENPTERSLVELKDKLKKFTELDYQILEQKASIRPTTKDRRPFIGESNQNKNALIFNGFGSKGVTLTPYFANQLANHLVNGIDLNSEVNTKRFY